MSLEWFCPCGAVGNGLLAAGILLHRFGTVDEHELRGCDSGSDPGLRAATIVFALGGLGWRRCRRSACSSASLLWRVRSRAPGDSQPT
jgi:hypothetical protein